LWEERQVARRAAVGDSFQGEQRTEAWRQLRNGRLTASAFSNALGFWNRGDSNGRRELWEEKLGLSAPFQGNEATRWGSAQEAAALEEYQRLMQLDVSETTMFKVWKDDPVHDWIGASPDGLISPPSPPGAAGGATGPGVLEIKCPFNKGEPEQAVPYRSMPYYYMPQVQGLMAIFDREWCDLFSWTVNGSKIYRVTRDREYWALMQSMLAEFWWLQVVPAKHAMRRGGAEAAAQFLPPSSHPQTERIISWSKRLAAESLVIQPHGQQR